MAFDRGDIPSLIAWTGIAALVAYCNYPRKLENVVIESVKNNDHYANFCDDYGCDETFIPEVLVCVKEPYQCFYSKDHDFIELKVGEKLKAVKYTPSLLKPYEEIVGYKR
jgi:hypothetical protein